jgi:hypothetical protein
MWRRGWGGGHEDEYRDLDNDGADRPLHTHGKFIPVQRFIKEFTDELITFGLHPVILIQGGGKHHYDTFLPDVFRQMLIGV